MRQKLRQSGKAPWLTASLVAAAIGISPGIARAACNGLTFCGTNGVWEAMNQLAADNCLVCHDDTSPAYMESAFNVRNVREWLASSYFFPGQPKVYAAYYRVANGLMPPGEITALTPKLQVFRDKLWQWYSQCLPSYSPYTSSSGLWGPTVMVNGDMRCE